MFPTGETENVLEANNETDQHLLSVWPGEMVNSTDHSSQWWQKVSSAHQQTGARFGSDGLSHCCSSANPLHQPWTHTQSFIHINTASTPRRTALQYQSVSDINTLTSAKALLPVRGGREGGRGENEILEGRQRRGWNADTPQPPRLYMKTEIRRFCHHRRVLQHGWWRWFFFSALRCLTGCDTHLLPTPLSARQYTATTEP